jgi:protein SCO1
MTTRTGVLLKPSPMRVIRHRLGGIVLLALFAVAATGCGEKKAPFNSMDVTNAPWGQHYALPNLEGKITTPQDFKGRITAVYFGFLYCPDACPTHLLKMNEIKALLGEQGKQIQTVFITVDPERDTPEKLKPYLESFDPTIVGLRGDLAQTEAVAKEFRVFYRKVDTKDSAKDPMAYTIDHTLFTYIYDTEGRLRLVVPHDLASDKIASDIKNLLAH